MPDRPGARRARRLLRGAIAVVAGGGLGLGMCLAALWLEHRRALTLPVPTGPFAVGRVVEDWRDAATPDPLAPVPGATRAGRTHLNRPDG